MAFSAPCHIKIICEDKLQGDFIASEIYKETKRLESKYSFFTADSVVSRLNNRTAERLELDDESLEILRVSLEFGAKTGFAFDIARAGTLKNGLNAGLESFANSSEVSLDGSDICFSNPYTKLDLGGVIKEYALDRAGEIIKHSGVHNALIDFAGDILTLGSKLGNPWQIGIKNPKDPSKDLLVLSLIDKAIATSGFYERGQHIVKHGDSRYIQASCLANSALEAGVFSTAFLANGKTKMERSLSAYLVDDALELTRL